jgi:hypothetical protein
MSLLLGGSVLIFMIFMGYALAELAWVVFAPFLVLLSQPASYRRYLVVLAALIAAFLATVSKTATPEIPWRRPYQCSPCRSRARTSWH